MRKVLVLGSTGMLGSAVGKHFLNQKKYETILTYRNREVSYGRNPVWFDAGRTRMLDLPRVDYIINCIGVIKPFIEDDKAKSIYLNSLFPRELAAHCKKSGIKLIHITTDCVFSGHDGNYVETAVHDCLDFYGKSKSLGEPDEDCMVIRTSIIGEEIHKDASLIAWVKSMKGKEINGYTNHRWNGITTKQYAKICERIIDENLYTSGLYHIASNTVTKYELVKDINEIFDLGITINPLNTPTGIDRTLRSHEDLSLMLMRGIPTLHEQILDLRGKTI
tara:strand:+ start:16364 stop:17194 length:831 start_codon:yes stop_codon:yes gene_type:complete